MNSTPQTGSWLIDAVALTAVSTFVLSLIKPFVERLPFATPASDLHDATLRLLNVVLNVVLTVLAYLAAGQITGGNWLVIAFQALGQAAGAQVLYTTTTRSGGSVNTPAPPVATALAGETATRATAGTYQTLSAAQIAAIANRRAEV